MRLDHPATGNSLSSDMVQQLDAAIDSCIGNGTQALLLEGAGSHFCTGFDLSDLDRESDDSLLARFVRVELVLQKLYRAPFVTAALAHGKTWGAGADLVACKLRWARADTTFAFPGAGFGLVLGSGRLAELIGAGIAIEWISSGRRIDAQEATACGLVQSTPDAMHSEQALAKLRSMVNRLDADALAQVCIATRTRTAADDNADLARLVRSAANAGVKARIVAYRAALRANK
jgi:enoyl-CoA hydratase/carnithine racemase